MFTYIILSAVFMTTPKATYQEGAVLVQFEENVRPFLNGMSQKKVNIPSVDQLFSQYGVKKIERVIKTFRMDQIAKEYGLDLIYLVFFPPEFDVKKVSQVFKENPYIKYADPNYIEKRYEIPNDPYYSQQWGLHKIQAAEAWDVTHGDTTVIIGIDDTGVDWNHPDLEDNIFQNLGEDADHDGHTLEYVDSSWVLDPGDLNGVDDDGNGYTDDLIGWDFYHNDNTPAPEAGNLPEHGTHVSGIASAVTNNGIGVAGVGYTCKILPLETQYVSNAINAIYYAVSMGVSVYNMSWGAPYVGSLGAALGYAEAHGVVPVAAAGNDSSSSPHYPAAFTSCIAVAATNGEDKKPSWSNYGDWIDVAAPGTNVLSTVPGGSYESWAGTSMSAPFVSGLAALIRSIAPDMLPESVRTILSITADSLPDDPYFMNGEMGAGRINAYKATLTVGRLFMSNVHLTNVELIDMGNGDGRPEAGEEFQIIITVQNGGEWQSANSLLITLNSNDSTISLTDSIWNVGSLGPSETASNSSNPFTFSVISSDPPHMVTVNFDYHANLKNFPQSEDYSFIVGQPYVMLVDDDGGDSLERYYTSALDSLSLVYDLWDISQEGAPLVSTVYGMSDHIAIIWFTGNAQNPISEEEKDSIVAALSGGAQLFISSQYLGEQWGGDPFYSDYLKATLLSANAHQDFVDGVYGDPVSDSIKLVLIGTGGANNSVSEDAIDALNGSVVTYKYSNSGEGAAIRYNDGYKLVYFGFPFESINDGASGNYKKRKDVLKKILRWFGVPTEVKEKTLTETEGISNITVSPSILGNDLKLIIRSSNKEKLKISLFDISGRKVKMLFDGPIPRGKQSLHFNLTGIPRGVYFVRFSHGLSPVKIIKVSR